MSLSVMMDRTLSAKDISNQRLDELLKFIPSVCTNEAILITETGVTYFRNCSEYLTNWICVEGTPRQELFPGNTGEQVFFSSDIRRCDDDGGQAPHDRVFMSVTFLDKSLDFGTHRRLDSSPQEMMYEHARRFECEKSEFLYAIIGVISSIQQHKYTFFDTHETEDSELMLMFYSSENKYNLISVMLNFNAITVDAELMDALDADESQLVNINDISDDDDFSLTDVTYKH